jgi:hypothetical protein
MKIETTLRQAAKQALEEYDRHSPLAVVMEELRAALAEEALQRLTDVHQEIEAALEQPEQEPYAEQSRRVEQETQGRMRINPVTGDVGIGSPPTRRKPLTDAEIAAIVREAAKGSAIKRDGSTSERIARAIEAAHGVKGEA